jgi:hypothetical protein
MSEYVVVSSGSDSGSVCVMCSATLLLLLLNTTIL